MLAGAIHAIVLLMAADAEREMALPDAKPVPEVQVLPLPNSEASFQHRGRELTRYYYG